VAATYDRVIAYEQSVSLARRLGNARLLTVDGDGHGSYRQGRSPCVDRWVVRYVERLALPPRGMRCRQQPQFGS
jgi:pimeloyl-ACP methyl ester carboxylesterase